MYLNIYYFIPYIYTEHVLQNKDDLRSGLVGVRVEMQ